MVMTGSILALALFAALGGSPSAPPQAEALSEAASRLRHVEADDRGVDDRAVLQEQAREERDAAEESRAVSQPAAEPDTAGEPEGLRPRPDGERRPVRRRRNPD